MIGETTGESTENFGFSVGRRWWLSGGGAGIQALGSLKGISSLPLRGGVQQSGLAQCVCHSLGELRREIVPEMSVVELNSLTALCGARRRVQGR